MVLGTQEVALEQIMNSSQIHCGRVPHNISHLSIPNPGVIGKIAIIKPEPVFQHNQVSLAFLDFL